MIRGVNLNSTIEELEGERWGEPTYPSHLVSECHRLRTIQLRLFTVENLRIMLGQNIGSRYLVPIALDHLDVEPFVEGDFYPGDLLCNVLSLPQSFWADHPHLRDRVAAVAARAMAAISGSGHEHGPIVAKAIRKAYSLFTVNAKLAV
jgi:hypothetical protein